MKFSVLLFLALISGCAAHKQKKQKPSPAHFAIPQECAQESHFTNKTVCKAVPGTSDKAVCSEMLTRYTCVKVAK
jgi:hypothetical protein